ncbi:hypothetical protein MKW94_026281 [Papaver nudicaule]|uniref:RING-type E3 ubiquitin transferase n=1 Tax=Papaver nudicaule TaxID=74823 RepID=A0AA41SKW3_PAPNU|nr:hypothetical protein [Papaver nudicaule]
MLYSNTAVLSNLFFILFFLRAITCQENCSSVQCSEAGNEPDIAFPFGNKDLQGAGCGYRGFNLTCNSFDKTVLKLPQSGEFLVRKIDYANREIRLYDQNNCLARPDYNDTRIRVRAFQVPCLSSPTNIVAVTLSSGGTDDINSTRLLINGGCEILAPVTVPIPFNAITKIHSYDFSTDDLYLTWNEPKIQPEVPKKVKKEGKKIDWKKIVAIVTPIIGVIGAIVTVVNLIRRCRRKR